MSNYNTQLQSNNTDLQTVLQTLQTKAAGGEQATPVISVNSTNGLITATAGTKTSTHQLAFQPAKTITPSTASQIAVSSGYYAGGDVVVEGIKQSVVTVTPKATGQKITADGGFYFTDIVVEGDSDLIAENIKSGVSIFGVSGTLESGGMSSGEQVEWSANEDAIISGDISGSYFNDRVENIGCNAFNNCYKLTTVNFPNVTSISDYAFNDCYKLTTVNFPNVTSISDHAFRGCHALTTVSLPNVTSVGYSVFRDCRALTTVSLPNVTSVGYSVFYNCSKLTTVSLPQCIRISGDSWNMAFANCYNLIKLYLTGSQICRLTGSYAFTSTPIGGYSKSAGTYGSIYVPASLLTSYQTATNWTYFSSRFVGI